MSTDSTDPSAPFGGLPRPTRVRHYAEAKARYGALTDVLVRALGRTDEVADAVVASFAELGAGRGRAMLERALVHGIESVDVAFGIRAIERVRRRVPALDAMLTVEGGRALERQIEAALAGAEPSFDARDRAHGGPAPWWARLLASGRGAVAAR